MTGQKSTRWHRALVVGSTILLMIILTFVSACVPAVQSNYQAYNDPRELIGQTGVNPTAAYPDLSLGVIYSQNAENAFQYIRETRELYRQWGMNEFDPAPLENGIKTILAKRFHQAERVTGLEDAAAKGLDLVMILDMKVVAGQMSGDETLIMINGIFMDTDGEVMGKVLSDGRQKIPFPARAVYNETVNTALDNFANTFDGSSELTARLENWSPMPEAASVQASIPAVQAAVDSGERTALVIGNGRYDIGPLRNPVNDATDMARVLREAGFKVTLLRNANQRTMENAIHQLGTSLRRGGTGLFYYAGHAVQVKGSNYLIPIGARIRTEGDIRYEAVDVGRVLASMEDAGNALNLVVLDACRNNPFSRSFRSAERGLAHMDAPRGSLIAYSTSPGDVAEDGKGRNGTYTKYLLQHMLTSGIAIEDVLKRVRIDVSDETGGKQVPWESSSLTGYFYFRKGE